MDDGGDADAGLDAAAGAVRACVRVCSNDVQTSLLACLRCGGRLPISSSVVLRYGLVYHVFCLVQGTAESQRQNRSYYRPSAHALCLHTVHTRAHTHTLPLYNARAQ